MYLVNKTLQKIIRTHPISCIYQLKAAVSNCRWSLSHVIEIIVDEHDPRIRALELDGFTYLDPHKL